MNADTDEDVILRNSAVCLVCGDEIVSQSRHDFRSCSCGSLSVDGGHAYLRRMGDPAFTRDTSIVAPDEPREHTLLNGPVIYNVHHSMLCKGRPCPIHNHSDHPLVLQPQDWDPARKCVLRICVHGKRHIDPDDLHAPCAPGTCDGCCEKR